jgi:hypothetical protein
VKIVSGNLTGFDVVVFTGIAIAAPDVSPL